MKNALLAVAVALASVLSVALPAVAAEPQSVATSRGEPIKFATGGTLATVPNGDVLNGTFSYPRF